MRFTTHLHRRDQSGIEKSVLTFLDEIFASKSEEHGLVGYCNAKHPQTRPRSYVQYHAKPTKPSAPPARQNDHQKRERPMLREAMGDKNEVAKCNNTPFFQLIINHMTEGRYNRKCVTKIPYQSPPNDGHTTQVQADAKPLTGTGHPPPPHADTFVPEKGSVPHRGPSQTFHPANSSPHPRRPPLQISGGAESQLRPPR